jgi:hypothetical protein
MPRSPIFNGGPSDIAYPNALDDFALIQGVPAFLANLEVGHMTTYAKSNGGKFGEVVSAWLKWQLKNDQKGRDDVHWPAMWAMYRSSGKSNGRTSTEFLIFQRMEASREQLHKPRRI